MPAPYFTTNPGDFLAHPGLYIQEIAPPGFIRGAGTNVLAIAGETLRGPVDTPTEITSFARFTEVFGHAARYGLTTSVNKVREFLMNKPFGKVIVTRAAAAAAATAEEDVLATATPIINIAASSAGAWGNDLTYAIKAASNAVSTSFNLEVYYRGQTTTYKNLSTNSTDNNLAEVIGTDAGNLVVVTKLANGRPDNIAANTLADTAGSDGTIADTDFTATDRAMDQIANYEGVSFCAVADRSNATIKAKVAVLAAAATDRIWIVWNGSHTETQANLVTDAALYRSDRIIYCYNSPYTYDFELGLEVRVPPHSWMASILVNVDVDVDPIDQDNRQYLAGISRLTRDSITRADFVTLKNAGLCTLEKRDGFRFAEGLVNLLTEGKTRITRRRSADFLLLSAASRLDTYVGKKNTLENRIQMGNELIAFSSTLKDQQRIIEDFVVDQVSQNTEATRAQGMEVIVWQVKLIGHILSLVLKAQIGETVQIAEAA